jgi:hypothetical protein
VTKPRRTLLLALSCLAVIVIGGAVASAQGSTGTGDNDRPPLGPVIISPELGDWSEYQRPLFRASEFDLVKVHLPPGFDTHPSHVEDLIRDGAQTIIFKTEDCASDGPTTFEHLMDSGFLDVVTQNPQIEFVMQVGNEPEHCQLSLQQYQEDLYQVITEVRPLVDLPNLRWVAGLPMGPSMARELLGNDWIHDLYDGVGTNMLVHFSLIDEYHNWHEIVDYVLDNTDTELWITEIGINHPPMDKSLKAERIMEYVDQLPVDRVGGVAIFTLGRGTEWPQYEVSEAMVPIFAGRADDNCQFFVATEEFLCGQFLQFWQRHGGLPIFGYPITPEMTNGQGEAVQFLERSRFEWHPGVWPEEYDVLLGHLGREMVRERKAEPEFQSLAPDSTQGEDCIYFNLTRQHLCDEFLDYWNDFGGLPVFGYPISQEFTENGFRVQYFERARFEHQPGVWAERYDVLQGLLGVQAVDGTLGDPLPD